MMTQEHQIKLLTHFVKEIDTQLLDYDAAAVVDALVEQEFASAGFSSGAYWLRLAGIRTTCTSGPHGLLRNWQARARVEIAAPAFSDDPINLQGSGPAPITVREG